MNILHIIPYFYPSFDIGGSARAVYDLSIRQNELGHSVTVFTTDLVSGGNRLRTPRKIILQKGLQIKYFSNLSTQLAYYQHVFFPPEFFWQVVKEVQSFDIVHFHEVFSFMHIWGMAFSYYNRIPFVVSPHGTLFFPQQAGRVIEKQIMFNMVFKYMFSKSAQIIALTQTEETAFLNLGINPLKISVIPNGVKVPVLTQRSKKRKYFRDKHHIDRDEVVSLFMGRIHPKKGIELLIKAHAKLNDDMMHGILLIVGPREDVEYFKYLHDLVEKLHLLNNVIFINTLFDEEKESCIEASDIFVLPSYSEGLPITLLEAASYGLPIITTTESGLKDLVSLGAGYCVAPKVEAIYFALKQLCQSKELRHSFGESARKMIDSNYSINNTTDRIISCYKKLLYSHA